MVVVVTNRFVVAPIGTDVVVVTAVVFGFPAITRGGTWLPLIHHSRNSPSTQIFRFGGPAGTDRGWVRDGRGGPEDVIGWRLGYASRPGKRSADPLVPPIPLRGHLNEEGFEQRPGEPPMKRVIRKVAEVVSVSAGLYRELALSALGLVPGRR